MRRRKRRKITEEAEKETGQIARMLKGIDKGMTKTLMQ